MLPLHTRAKVSGTLPHPVLKVLGLAEALGTAVPRDRVAVHLPTGGPEVDFAALQELGFAALFRPDGGTAAGGTVLPEIHSLSHPEVVGTGDVVRVRQDNGQVGVLYRRGANANTLFLTEQCNSRCLMCSQPPRDEDDLWRVRELLELIPLVDPDLAQLGFTGGEPTLLGPLLPELLRACAAFLPQTGLHILTNGRNFSDPTVADMVGDALGRATWAIPLYADVPARHDYVVQAKGAFEQTVQGVYNLAERGHVIEIRFVVHAQTLPRLREFPEFVWRNMPFVSHVAFMGMEPMGYAKVNRNLLWVDPLDYGHCLSEAAWHLQDRGIPTSIYNVPLCVLPEEAWPLARQSISDWKNTYEPACDGCAVKQSCCGFFASHGPAWRSRGIKPFERMEAAE
ncbi:MULTISPECIES: His-Xaa-Ser system radical SAM maturase HxsC [unclassified Azospirillum]|uniref:His-Xaa-Ser system radical SAM maturase HxsC n=1 Tax=unclassified Azospirillum TaxID=2630922 RepID=UPI000B627331|nr:MULTISPECIES: His-Xaa-Ser system radical SAM maturase HxsC [unclassified Azospirillum]SNS88032.1 His-Xaa-Ser system radical SAM maturase HxsC [Azospirillum sp. RU38E]SNT05002.1 His-Xaa-Ser system radical SAM maturase HxsC [Azospirillum sp. RU37A]